MATLNSTKYPNNSRVVFGTVNVYQDDSILLCNTTLGSVTINLDTIPANYWNTTWKLYVKDNTNNASVNNITINAGVGQTINGQSSLVISANGQSTIIRISSNNSYLSESPSGYTTIQDEGVALPQRQILDFQGANVTATDNGVKTIVTITAPPAFDIIDITYAAFNALVLANTVQKGWFYRITDAGFTDEGAIIQGTTLNTNSIQGSGIFLNADYQNVGDYSGVSGFVSNLGVWTHIVQPVVIGNVVIWNNKHWKNLTGAWGTFPDTDAINWQLLTKSTTNGYIKEVDLIKYNLSSNSIIYRADKRYNEVEYSQAYTFGFEGFKWGDDNTIRNKVTNNSFIVNRNSYGIIDGNIVSNLSGLTNDTAYTTILPQIKYNFISSNSFLNVDGYNGVDTTGIIFYNKIQSSSEIRVVSLDSTSSVSDNDLSSASIMYINSLVNTTFNQNVLDSGASFNMLLTGTSTNGYFRNNKISQKSIYFDSINSTIEKYILEYNYSTFPITLDMSDPAIWNAGTQTLTISNNNKPFGIVTLLNCTGKTILKIVGVDTFEKIFIPNVGETVTFQHTLIGASANNDLVCDAPASANLLTGRANGSDYIVYKVLGGRNLRSNMVLLA